MTATLAIAVASLLVLIGAVIAFDAGIRLAARRAQRQERMLRPAAEREVAGFLAGTRPGLTAAGPADRVILLRVGLEALAQLRGSERDRLAAELERLGFVGEAAAGLSSRRRVQRRRCADILARIASPGTVPALRAGLLDTDPIVRCGCARTLAEIGPAAVLPTVAATARRDLRAVPGHAAAVVLALGNCRPDVLAGLLAPENGPKMRAQAVRVAAELRLSQHADALRACLADPDDVLAAEAARGLGLIGEVRAVAALEEAALDVRRAQAVRVQSVIALGSIGSPASQPVLASLLTATGWAIRDAAAQALAGIGEAGRAVLRAAASSANGQVSLLAEAALQR